jgi:excisionase family DNA binding protein
MPERGYPVVTPESPTVLTTDEVAAELRVPRRQVMSMARTRELPMFKVRREWRITRETLDEWTRAREAALVLPRTPARRPGQGRR